MSKKTMVLAYRDGETQIDPAYFTDEVKDILAVDAPVCSWCSKPDAYYSEYERLDGKRRLLCEVSLWADLEDGDDPAVAADALRTMARHHVMAELANVESKLKAKVQDIFMGLPIDVQSKMEIE